MRITLAKAARVPLKGPIRDRGYSAEVDEDTYQALKSHGVLADTEKPEVKVEVKTETEQEAVQSTKKSGPKRPAKSAPVQAWRDYADSRGIKTGGLTRSQIIGAVKKIDEDRG